MGAGFIRRFGFFPGNEVITQIEGVVIVDLPPPGSVQGVDAGVACLVGEFADMTYATAVDSSGIVTTFVEPQEIFSSQDMIDKVGGFDETLGDFGLSDGNGFVALRNKRYARLVVAPVNLASAQGVRYVRQLPLCATQTNTLPVVPVSGGTVAAGREFRNGTAGRMRVAARVNFTSFDPIMVGTGGATTNAAAAATQTFTVSGVDFTTVARPDGTVGIKKGDIIVIGNNNAGALQPLPSGGNLGAGTYRVASDAGAATTLALEQLQGGNFAFVTATTIPFRIHVSSDADSAPVIVVGNSVPGGYAAADVGGYTIPTRPLTNNAGAFVDGNWTAAAINPLVAPPALTGSTWDPLSGLLAVLRPSGTALAFTAAIQQPNTPSSASMDAVYLTAFDATISELDPVASINMIWSARTSLAIRGKIKSNVLDASTRSRGRSGVIRPESSVQTTTNAVASADPGVGGNRDERVDYTWPAVRTFVPEAVNFRLKVADGTTTIDGILDVGFDAYLVSLMSNLPPERNPGQAANPVPQLLASVLGFQRGVVKLEMNDYITLRKQGVAAVRIDRTIGPVLQSGITTSLISGQKNINRRRMADFVEDSLAERLVSYSKLPLTTANKDNATAEATAFGEELLQTDAPAKARIKSYSVDDKSGNTPANEALGIFVIIFKARTLPTGDFIVIQSEIGENVVTTTQLEG